MKAEKEALAKAVERQQGGIRGRLPGNGARGLRDVVRGLEGQLLRERAESQRTANKREQEQRLLREQVWYYITSLWKTALIPNNLQCKYKHIDECTSVGELSSKEMEQKGKVLTSLRTGLLC